MSSMLSIDGAAVAPAVAGAAPAPRSAAVRAPLAVAVAALIVLGAYLLLTEPNAPLLRSAIMAAALCASSIFPRRHSPLNALAAAGVILLIADPLQLFNAGFQLSFGLVAGFLLLNEPLRRMLFGRWIRRRGLIVFRHDQRVRRWLHFKLGDWAMSAVTLSLIACLVSTPLVAYHFHLFSPYAALLSLLLSPLVAAVLVPGYLSAALAWLAPSASHYLGAAAAAAAHALAQSIEAMQRLPGLCLDLRDVGPVAVMAFYVAVAAVFLRHRLPRGNALACLAALAAVAAGAYSQRPAAKPLAAELNLLSVGAGQCAVLRTPSGRTYIVDAGSRGGMDVYRQALQPFLRNRRLATPTAAFVSHANTDHYNALLPLAQSGRLKCLYMSGVFMASADGAALSFIQRIKAAGVEVRVLSAGSAVQLDDRTRVDVLWPPATLAQADNVNDTSLVLKISCDGQAMILPGDIGPAAQNALCRQPERLVAGVLVLPHHGSWDAALPQFVAAVNPRVALISDARDDLPQLARGAARDFYRRLTARCRCYATSSEGCIRLQANANLAVQTMRSAKEDTK